jgi:ribosome biogenesis GTPase
VTLGHDSAGAGRIVDLRPRRNRFSRRAAGSKPAEQVIAANLDLVIAVIAAARPKPRWAMLDRYLVQAAATGIPVLICITKTDLVDRASLESDAEVYRQAGYEVLTASAASDLGLAELRQRLRGEVSLFVGKSGVGKTSLISALLTGPERTGPGKSAAAAAPHPEACGDKADRRRLRTANVNPRSGKGRHTTSSVRLFPLPGGGGLIDTPGARTFALWGVVPERAAMYFPEMRPLVGACRFGSRCSHSHEIGCAIKEAVRSGQVNRRRYQSLMRLMGKSADLRRGEAVGSPAGGAESRSAIQGFVCGHCHQPIAAGALGSAHRNHCPACLWSLHVDHEPGDRAAACGGLMEPIAIAARSDGEWTLVHRCRECSTVKANRIAGDDNPAMLISLASRPLARPPFPLDRVGQHA